MGNARQQPRLSSVRSVALRAEHFYDHSGRVFPWRRPTATRYHQVVTEVLLQQTRADTVASFFPIFLEHFPNWSALAKATEEEIGQVILPLGLWRRRARSLQRLAREVSQRGGRFPAERTRVEAMPAIGQYVANAVELFCHRRPRPLLDGGMARILERYFGPRDLADIRHDPYLQPATPCPADLVRRPRSAKVKLGATRYRSPALHATIPPTVTRVPFGRVANPTLLNRVSR